MMRSKYSYPMALSFIALFAALCAAGTFIMVPLPFSPVPVILQNFFALLSGLVLGPILGGMAVGLYLLTGALGLPIFSGSRGGIAHILGPTGGYLIGYVLAAISAGIIAGWGGHTRKPALWRLVLGVSVGLLMVYVPGLLRLKAILDTSWKEVIVSGFLPFLPGDIAKGVLAVLVAPRLRKTAMERLDV